MLLRAVFQWKAVPLEALGDLWSHPWVLPLCHSEPGLWTIFLDGQSLFIAERCRPTDGGDFQVSNYLPSSAAPEGRQPETERIEAAGTVFDSKHSPVECVSPGNEQAFAQSVFLALLNPLVLHVSWGCLLAHFSFNFLDLNLIHDKCPILACLWAWLPIVLVSFCPLGIDQSHLGSGNLRWGTAPIQLFWGHVQGGIFLIDLWARGQPTVGGTIPGQVGPWVV